MNKRSADSAGLDMMSGAASDSDEDSMVDVKPAIGGGDGEGAPGGGVRGRGSSAGSKASAAEVAASKKTRGRVKIKMEFIDNKLRRYTTFSKRKTGIMKKVSKSTHLIKKLPHVLGILCYVCMSKKKHPYVGKIHVLVWQISPYFQEGKFKRNLTKVFSL